MYAVVAHTMGVLFRGVETENSQYGDFETFQHETITQERAEAAPGRQVVCIPLQPHVDGVGGLVSTREAGLTAGDINE